MFTGLVTGLGEVVDVAPAGGGRDARFTLRAPDGFLDGVATGASILCSGCCLTAVAHDPHLFSVEVSAETLSVTTLGTWRAGTRVNLERSLRMGDELGGHLVSGHVDAVGALRDRATAEGSLRLRFALPPALAPLVAGKGSIAVDGVSLTVNEAGDADFGVNVIPHTAAVTTLGGLRPGDPVNVEIDLLARYVARILGAAAPGPAPALSA